MLSNNSRTQARWARLVPTHKRSGRTRVPNIKVQVKDPSAPWWRGTVPQQKSVGGQRCHQQGGRRHEALGKRGKEATTMSTLA